MSSKGFSAGFMAANNTFSETLIKSDLIAKGRKGEPWPQKILGVKYHSAAMIPSSYCVNFYISIKGKDAPVLMSFYDEEINCLLALTGRDELNEQVRDIHSVFEKRFPKKDFVFMA